MLVKILPLCCVLRVGWGSHEEGVGGANDQTSVTTALNNMIATKPGTVYGGGKGVIFRNINDGLVGKTVVPATLIVNDIYSANIAYPNGNPMCPSLGDDGYNKGKPCTADPYINAVVGVVIGSSMSKLFHDFDNIQNTDWGWGVFYGTDSNSVDHRCAWNENKQGWDCPGTWIDIAGHVKDDPTQKGSGSYAAGNPLAGLGGGGAGCHYNVEGKGIDQFDSDGTSLVGNQWCECNYALNGKGWQAWVEEWIQHGKAKPQFPGMGWFDGGKKKAPNWAVDEGICWVNNPRDMIYLQNMMWFHRWDWSNQLMPQSYWNIQVPETQRYYWGWNEVPLNANDVNSPQNWDAIVIKIPVAICGGIGGTDSINCMPVAAQKDLEDQLAWHESNGFLKLGENNVKSRPGSYVVLLREWQQAPNYWQRWFFCESWVADKYSVNFKGINGKFLGECYVDHGNGKAPQPPTCDGKQGAFAVNRDKTKCLDIVGGNLYNGVGVQIWDCNGLSNQHFIWCSDNRVVSAVNTNMCLDIPGGAPGYSTNLQMWECNGRESQKWGFDSKTLSIYPVAQGEVMCVDLDSGSTTKGTRVNVFPCQPGTGEKWSLVSPPPNQCWGEVGFFRPKRDMSKCLDIVGGKIYNGASVQVWDCNGQKQQQWMWCNDNRIASAMDENYCLDIPGDVKQPTYLQIWSCTGADNQRWGYDGRTLSVYPASTGEQMCMDLDSGSLKAGTKVNIYPCTPGNGEAWILGNGVGLPAPHNATPGLVI